MRKCIVKHKKYILRCLICVLFVGMMLLPAAPVYANDWVEKSTTPYGGNSVSDASNMQLTEGEPGIIESYIANFLAWIASQINTAMSNSVVNMSVDGIVLGRMADNTDVAYSQFDLNQGNPWGIIGAYMYRFFRTVVYSAFLISFVLQVGLAMRKRTVAKDRAEFKEYLLNVVFFFVLLSAFPKIVDYILYARDCLMYAAVKSIGGSSGLGVGTSAGVGIVGAFKEAYEAEHSFFNSVLFLASSCAGVFFFMDYIATALIQMGLFGGSGWVFLRSTKDKKLLATWSSTFFPNICIPLIDTLLLLVPLAVQAIFEMNVANVASVPLSIRLIQLVCIWSIVPTRNAIMRYVLGSLGMAANRSGIGGLLALGSAAVSALSGAARGIGKGRSRSDDSEKSSSRNDSEMAQESREQSEVFDDANRRTREGMSDVSDLLGEKQEHADVGGIGDEYRSMEDSGENMELQEILDGESGMGRGAELGEMHDFEPIEPNREDEAIENSIGSSAMDERVLDDDSMIASVDDIPSSATMPSDVDTMAGIDDYANIPNMRDDFANSLRDDEKDRYANLNARDALRDKLSSNSDRLSYINEQMSNDQDYLGKLKSEGADLSSEMKSRQETVSHLENRNRSIDKQLSELTGQQGEASKIQSLQAERVANNAAIASANKEIRGFEQQIEKNAAAQMAKSNDVKAWRNEATAIQQHNQKLQNGIEKCTNREKQYAQNYAAAGMSNRVFSSAENFKTTKVSERNLEKHMNYKNFDSGRFDAVLTPQQRAEMYHQRAVKGAINKVGSTALKAAGAAATISVAATGATVAATMATYGGPGAMVSAGAAGGMAGGMAGSAGNSILKGGHEAIKKAPGAIQEGKVTYDRAVKKSKEVAKKVTKTVRQKQTNTSNTANAYSKKPASKTSSKTSYEREMLRTFNNDAEANAEAFKKYQG